MPIGRIVKALSGFYYVQEPDRLVECRGSGKLRHRGSSPLVGDLVEYSVDTTGNGRIEQIQPRTGFHVLPVSAETGEGIEDLRRILSGKLCAFTGDSGVGKSSILNALNPAFSLRVGEVSDKLGRGRHTTRHVELFDLGEGTYLIDTPGFASFDMEAVEPVRCGQLQYDFPEFEPFLGQCRFQDCAHLKEPDCAVRAAVERGEIHPKRYQSYRLMYADASKYKEWELKN